MSFSGAVRKITALAVLLTFTFSIGTIPELHAIGTVPEKAGTVPILKQGQSLFASARQLAAIADPAVRSELRANYRAITGNDFPPPRSTAPFAYRLSPVGVSRAELRSSEEVLGVPPATPLAPVELQAKVESLKSQIEVLKARAEGAKDELGDVVFDSIRTNLKTAEGLLGQMTQALTDKSLHLTAQDRQWIVESVLEIIRALEMRFETIRAERLSRYREALVAWVLEAVQRAEPLGGEHVEVFPPHHASGQESAADVVRSLAEAVKHVDLRDHADAKGFDVTSKEAVKRFIRNEIADHPEVLDPNILDLNTMPVFRARAELRREDQRSGVSGQRSEMRADLSAERSTLSANSRAELRVDRIKAHRSFMAIIREVRGVLDTLAREGKFSTVAASAFRNLSDLATVDGENDHARNQNMKWFAGTAHELLLMVAECLSAAAARRRSQGADQLREAGKKLLDAASIVQTFFLTQQLKNKKPGQEGTQVKNQWPVASRGSRTAVRGRSATDVSNVTKSASRDGHGGRNNAVRSFVRSRSELRTSTPVHPLSAATLRGSLTIKQGIGWMKQNLYIFGGGFGYDIRINDARTDWKLVTKFAYAMGRTLGGKDYLNAQDFSNRKRPRALILSDQRVTSDPLRHALVIGLADEGVDVVTQQRGSAITTGLASRRGLAEDFDLVIQITGSHNPAAGNGFKITYRGLPFYGRQLLELADAISGKAGWSKTRKKKPFVERPEQGLITEHVEALNQALPDLSNSISLIADFRGGAAGKVFTALAQLKGYDVLRLDSADDSEIPDLAFNPSNTPLLIALNEEPSGTMAAGIWDPSKPEAFDPIKKLQQRIYSDTRFKGRKFAGVVFDGDGDRSGFANEDGELVMPERMLIAFYQRMILANIEGIRALNRLGPSLRISHFVKRIS